MPFTGMIAMWWIASVLPRVLREVTGFVSFGLTMVCALLADGLEMSFS